MSKKEYIKSNTMKLKGKDYLEVARRVIVFRKDHPAGTILTKAEVNEEGTVTRFRAQVINGDGRILAEGTKALKRGGGPAGQFPIETTETGAVGRALAFAGYGTLAGDLDMGDILADAPVDLTKITEGA